MRPLQDGQEYKHGYIYRCKQMKQHKTPESDLQTRIVSALRFRGFLVYSNYQNIATDSFRKGDVVRSKYAMYAQLKKTGHLKGIPDLTVIGVDNNGNRIRLYIECKSPKGKLSTSQKEMIAILEALGEEVRVVRELKQIDDLLEMDMCRIEALLV